MAASGPRAKAAGRKLLVVTSGSRGDVQPFLSLGIALQKAGFTVLLATNTNHVDFIKRAGLDAVACSTIDVERAVNENDHLRNSMATGDLPKFMAALGDLNKKEFPESFKTKVRIFDSYKPDLVVTTTLEVTADGPLCQLRGIPVVLAGLQAAIPSSEQPTMMGEPSWCPHRMFGVFMMYLFFAGERDSKNDSMLKQIPEIKAFMPLDFRQFMLFVCHPLSPCIVGFSPSLNGPKSDWTEECKKYTTFSGFWCIDKKEQQAKFEQRDVDFGGKDSEALKAFVAKGPPVYMGWGSMIAVSDQHMVCLAVRALMESGLRGIILGGWAKLTLEKVAGSDQPDTEAMKDYCKENVLFVQTAPHEWLFPQCSVIVHHGGAGTTAAALRSGVPTVITPCFLDQFYHANLVNESGVGIGMKHLAKVPVKDLSAALKKCAGDKDMLQRAQVLAKKLLSEDGCGAAAKAVDDFFLNEVDTGIYASGVEKRRKEFAFLQSQRSPSCFAWIGRLCCSSAPNDYSVRLP